MVINSRRKFVGSLVGVSIGNISGCFDSNTENSGNEAMTVCRLGGRSTVNQNGEITIRVDVGNETLLKDYLEEEPNVDSTEISPTDRFPVESSETPMIITVEYDNESESFDTSTVEYSSLDVFVEIRTTNDDDVDIGFYYQEGDC